MLFSAHGRYRAGNEEIRSVFDENIFLGTAKKNDFNVFSIFFESDFFCWLGPGISLSAQTPPKKQ